jgi:hypothetical protein
MVIAGGLERMTFEVLNVIRRSGAGHAIVTAGRISDHTIGRGERRQLVGGSLLGTR